MILYKNKKLVIPTGINPHYLEDSSVLNNQDKEITITSNGKTTLVHDPGFSGLGTVTINTYVGEVSIQPFYSTTITENGDYDIFPDEGYDAIAELEITVNVQPELEAKIVDSSTNEQVVTTDKYGLSSVTVNPYTLDEKTVDSSTNPQVITSDEDGLKQVTINPYVLSPLEVDSSTASQEITGQFGTVTVNPYTLDEKTVDSSTNAQTITSDVNGLSKVTINPYVLSPLEVDSSTATQTRTGQFGTVTVNPYTLDSSSAVITENGDYAFESSADGLSRVDVTVNLDTQSYYNEGYSNGKSAGIAEGIAEQKAKLDSSTFTLNGTYTREDGWNSVTVNVDTVNNQNKTVDSSIATQIVTPDSGYTGLGQVTVNPYTLTAKTVNPSTSTQNVVPGTGYNGLSKVTVNAVTSSIDTNITAGNIKKDVTILGVTGTYEGSGTATTPGIPYIELTNSAANGMIYLGLGAWPGEYSDVCIICDFSSVGSATFSAFNASTPNNTTKCIVGLAGYDNDSGYGIALGAPITTSRANTIYMLAGDSVSNTAIYDTSPFSYSGSSSNSVIRYRAFMFINDIDDNQGQSQVIKTVHNSYDVTTLALTNWKASGVVIGSGEWAVFGWDDRDDMYNYAPNGTRIYELHIKIGSNLYDFYPVKVGNYGGLAKYKNGVFIENLTPATPSYVNYGVLI